MPVGNNT